MLVENKLFSIEGKFGKHRERLSMSPLSLSLRIKILLQNYGKLWAYAELIMSKKQGVLTNAQISANISGSGLFSHTQGTCGIGWTLLG
jgi:hypothetical protein